MFFIDIFIHSHFERLHWKEGNLHYLSVLRAVIVDMSRERVSVIFPRLPRFPVDVTNQTVDALYINPPTSVSISLLPAPLELPPGTFFAEKFAA